MPASLRWLEKAANQGHPVAQFHLGGMLLRGRGVKPDAKSAFPWWRRASLQGFAPAQPGLGMLYANGQGVKRDDKEAYRWFTIAMRAKEPQVVQQASLMRRQLARRMDPDAIFEGGELARKFKPVPETAGGATVLQPKAETGDAKAQLELAQLLAEAKEPEEKKESPKRSSDEAAATDEAEKKGDEEPAAKKPAPAEKAPAAAAGAPEASA